MKLKPYREIRSELQSGDIALFRGEGLISTAILWFCSTFNWLKKTKYSHIGMIVVDSGRAMLFESTTLNGKNGVQLNPFSARLQEYKGQVYIRHLRYKRGIAFHSILASLIEEFLGRFYEKNLLELMGAAAEIIHMFDGHKPDLSTIFCSELVSEIFKRMGFLAPDIPSNEYEPDDYDFKGKVDVEFSFSEEDIGLSNVIRIK